MYEIHPCDFFRRGGEGGGSGITSGGCGVAVGGGERGSGGDGVCDMQRRDERR